MLESVNAKLVRADRHLQDLLVILGAYADGKCTIRMEEDQKLGGFVLRVRIEPRASEQISAIAGDFLANVRAALDYLVSGLAGAATGGVRFRSSQFPIAGNLKAFEDELRRQRLRGVPAEAAALIESLQPYNTGKDVLNVLARMHNQDKHRTPNVVAVVADNARLVATGIPFLLGLGDEELYDGAVFGGIVLPYAAARKHGMCSRLPDMEMQGECSLFVAFQDEAGDSLSEWRVDATLVRILGYVRDEVVPQFDRFLG